MNQEPPNTDQLVEDYFSMNPDNTVSVFNPDTAPRFRFVFDNSSKGEHKLFTPNGEDVSHLCIAANLDVTPTDDLTIPVLKVTIAFPKVEVKN